MPPSKYEYSPIANGNFVSSRNTVVEPDDGRQPVRIRLLELIPSLGVFSDDIHVELRTVWLGQANLPKYEALSYVWGSAVDLEAIYVGQDKESTLDVTKNLATALRHLRHQSKSRTMWIDAISINQQDMVERTNQVANMGKIYRLADRVIGWLGSEQGDSGYAMSVLNDLGSKVDVDLITGSLKLTRLGRDEPHLAEIHKPLAHAHREILAVAEVLERPWFDRLWIRQEIYLGHDRATLQIGNQTISWERFRKASICIWKKSYVSDDKLQPSISRVMARLEFMNELLFGTRAELINLRRLFGRCQCSDRRDRVFAVSNMVSPNEREIIGSPDYSLSWKEVWKKTTLSYLTNPKTTAEGFSLQILNECRGKEPFQVPTWVPAWTIDEDDTNRTFDCFGHAGGPFAPKIECLPGNVLRILGVCLGKIRRTVDCGDFATTVREFINEENPERPQKEMATPAVPHRPPPTASDQTYPGGGSFLDACAYTCVAGYNQESSVPVRPDTPLHNEVNLAIEAAINGNDEELDRWYVTEAGTRFNNVVRVCFECRCLFNTANGYVGLGPSGIIVGDIIVAFAGGQLPMILRQTAAGSGRYYLIGPCYAAGFMFSEAYLGRLPTGYRFSTRDLGNGKLQVLPFNINTQSFEVEDPRLQKVPVDWTDYLKAVKGQVPFAVDLNIDEFRRSGVDVEFFDII